MHAVQDAQGQRVPTKELLPLLAPINVLRAEKTTYLAIEGVLGEMLMPTARTWKLKALDFGVSESAARQMTGKLQQLASTALPSTDVHTLRSLVAQHASNVRAASDSGATMLQDASAAVVRVSLKLNVRSDNTVAVSLRVLNRDMLAVHVMPNQQQAPLTFRRQRVRLSLSLDDIVTMSGDELTDALLQTEASYDAGDTSVSDTALLDLADAYLTEQGMVEITWMRPPGYSSDDELNAFFQLNDPTLSLQHARTQSPLSPIVLDMDIHDGGGDFLLVLGEGGTSEAVNDPHGKLRSPSADDSCVMEALLSMQSMASPQTARPASRVADSLAARRELIIPIPSAADTLHKTKMLAAAGYDVDSV